MLRAIRQHGPSTRGDLSQHMGVTFPTVAKAVGTLIDARLLEEFDDVVTGPGRPAKRLRLSKERAQVVGLTVDVQSCEIAAAGFDGVLREDSRQTFATPRTLRRIARRHRRADRVTRRATRCRSCRVGISVVGLVDYRRQEIRLAASLPFLNGKQLGRISAGRVKADCVLVHDAHALCLAEYVYGQASDLDSFVVLDMCTGIGMGVMVNSMFLTGHNGFAGEMGHIPVVTNGSMCRCGRRGCLETVASEWALVERVSKGLGRRVDFDEVMSLALDGDKLVRSELNRVCKYLAMALAHVVNLFDPQCVFVNGRLFDELPWLRDHLGDQGSAAGAGAGVCRLPLSAHQWHASVRAPSPPAISAVTASRVHELQDTLSGITFNVTRRSVS